MKFLNGVWKLTLGLILFAISIILTALLTPWGIVEEILSYFVKKRFRSGLIALGELFKLFAVIIDTFGNVVLRIPLNRILNTQHGYRFGSRFDTISYVLGHGLVHSTLSKSGYKLTKILNFFEKDHCLKVYYNRHPELK